jgi:alkylhydroperoxidase/carboxymuconolactone decarboxylase family protein YurZ
MMGGTYRLSSEAWMSAPVQVSAVRNIAAGVRMLNIAMLTALNRPHELKLHVQGALTNGVNCIEIREVLMQTAIYCGIPAAVDAFRSASEVFNEIDKK